MKNLKIIYMFFVLIVLISPIAYCKEPEITANSAAVIECIDGKFLYSKDMDEKLYPASMTNVLTAILVVENCNMEDEVIISQNAINSVQSGYLTANIKPGEVLTVEQLLNLLLISSYNDVANALAEHIAGSVDDFAKMMNEKAKEIGCTNSNFINSNGAHDENHYSTAHDMALIGKYAMQYEEIKSVVSKLYYKLGTTNKYSMDDRLYQTTNEMLLTGSVNYYKYAKGIKTGFTTPAGYCFMTYSVKDDIPLVAVVMKSTTSDSRYDDTKKILEYAYDNNSIKTIVQLGTNVQTINVKNASKDTKKLNVIVGNTIVAVVKNENIKKSVEPVINLQKNLKAPIEKGGKIGTVSYEFEGKIYTADLIAESNVEKSHTGLTFGLIFLGIISILGYLRIRSLYKRNKTLKKIRVKK